MKLDRVDALATCRQALNVCLRESAYPEADTQAAVVARDVKDAGGAQAVLDLLLDVDRAEVVNRVLMAASVNVTCWRFAVEAEANPNLKSANLVDRSRARLEMYHAKAEANRACLGLTAAVDAYHAFEDARRFGGVPR